MCNDFVQQACFVFLDLRLLDLPVPLLLLLTSVGTQGMEHRSWGGVGGMGPWGGVGGPWGGGPWRIDSPRKSGPGSHSLWTMQDLDTTAK